MQSALLQCNKGRDDRILYYNQLVRMTSEVAVAIFTVVVPCFLLRVKVLILLWVELKTTWIIQTACQHIFNKK